MNDRVYDVLRQAEELRGGCSRQALQARPLEEQGKPISARPRKGQGFRGPGSVLRQARLRHWHPPQYADLAAVMEGKTMGHRNVRTAMQYQHPELRIVRAAL
jgi:hypothetical protein